MIFMKVFILCLCIKITQKRMCKLEYNKFLKIRFIVETPMLPSHTQKRL